MRRIRCPCIIWELIFSNKTGRIIRSKRLSFFGPKFDFTTKFVYQQKIFDSFNHSTWFKDIPFFRKIIVNLKKKKLWQKKNIDSRNHISSGIVSELFVVEFFHSGIFLILRTVIIKTRHRITYLRTACIFASQKFSVVHFFLPSWRVHESRSRLSQTKAEADIVRSIIWHKRRTAMLVKLGTPHVERFVSR